MSKRHVEREDLLDAARSAVPFWDSAAEDVQVECAMIAGDLDRFVVSTNALYGSLPLRRQRAIVALWLFDRIRRAAVDLPTNFLLLVLSYELGSNVVTTAFGFEEGVATGSAHVALLRERVGLLDSGEDLLDVLVAMVHLIATTDDRV